MNADLDHEAAAGLEMARDIPKAGDLCFLSCQVVDRIEDEAGDDGGIDHRRVEHVGAHLVAARVATRSPK